MEWYTVLPFVALMCLVPTSDGRTPPMCEHQESYYHHGETVTYKCVTAMCFRGRKWKIVKAGCPFRDTCLENGQTVSSGECQSVQCRVNKRMTRSKLLYKLDCPWKGECMKNRETWMVSCIKYQCRVKQDTAKVMVAKKGCEWLGDNKCYKLGTKKTASCMQYQCKEDSNGALGFVLVSPGCEKIGSRGCAKPKEQWWDIKTCRHFTCVVSMDDSGNVVGTKTQDEQGCAGINNPKTCHEVGDTWLEFSRKDRTCLQYTCTTTGSTVQVPKGACFHEGECLKNGEEHEDEAQCFCRDGDLLCLGIPVTGAEGTTNKPTIIID
ncbi:hypothetical protein KP79_PYT13940 [Mizuhopecten yessoensis]|uniref:Uncharacterized protein n=1 Tax=Mizuhopecten yessoensis TaxID=6573 RepID=A0A210QGZ8_MIZYE|nr:hypothetical protein KP79_PYT13940 [Mizuhopecten yessoensis]